MGKNNRDNEQDEEPRTIKDVADEADDLLKQAKDLLKKLFGSEEEDKEEE